MSSRLPKQSPSQGPDEFYAHSENCQGVKHRLMDHLTRTAELARSFAPREQLQQAFYLAGLLHDSGKFQEDFQKYLLYGVPRTPHAGLGAFIAKAYAKQWIHLQFAIQGHHAGMPDNQERQGNIAAHEDDEETAGLLLRRFRENITESSPFEIPEEPFAKKDLLLSECATRFLFSALTDADWLDTERHFTPEKAQVRVSATLDCQALLDALKQKFKNLPTEGVINELRTRARNEVIKNCRLPMGFFSLQLPTGLGKTLTSVYWALLHAQHHSLRRIIIVLPYISIIDQTASILKEVFGEDTVLEHHSGVMEEDESYAKEIFDRGPQSAKQLACENWDAPIIVTTSVQFFESLFSNRPFKCRKNHNIVESVVIFDEVQTLPKQLAEPTIVMLKNIAALAKTTFLFCTATMPAFAKRPKFDGIEATTSLISNPRNYFDATRRVEYKLLKGLKPVALDTVAEQISKERQSYLVVVNTKSVAAMLYAKLKAASVHECYYHLSTAMCPHHRKRTIAEIIDDLKNGKRIAAVTTQLVEAGVDLDFPAVYRAIAPLDAVIQAAGRCNRNGTMKKKGKVTLFDLVDHRMPDNTYRSCAGFAKGIIQDNAEVLHNADSFECYYEQVIELFVDPDRYRISEERGRFNFKTVNDQYRIIDDRTTPLLIANYSVESNTLLAETLQFFNAKGFIPKEQYRILQQYSVQVYPNFLSEFEAQIAFHESGLRIWYGSYDDDLGLTPADIETVF